MILSMNCKLKQAISIALEVACFTFSLQSFASVINFSDDIGVDCIISLFNTL